MNDFEIKDDFRFMLPPGNASWELIWNLLYDIRLLKFVHHSQIKLLPRKYSKICSKEKMLKLVDLGYLRTYYDDVFVATDKAVDLLKFQGKDIKLLPDKIVGNGYVNEINNTEVFIQAMKLSDYFHLFFPRFPADNPYIIPDALLVLKKNGKYKLTFLEIEKGKPDWSDYLETKRENYLRLSNDIISFNYWTKKCQLLGWAKPDLRSFKFNVMFICSVKYDWEDYFIFQEALL